MKKPFAAFDAENVENNLPIVENMCKSAMKTWKTHAKHVGNHGEKEWKAANPDAACISECWAVSAAVALNIGKNVDKIFFFVENDVGKSANACKSTKFALYIVCEPFFVPTFSVDFCSGTQYNGEAAEMATTICCGL